MKKQKLLLLCLTLISGFLLLSQDLDYQTMLSQGDHGRDLYAFEASLNGQIPYRDYWWVYGPAMPYYYAAFFKIFGISIKSVLLGKFFLNMLCGAFFFLILSLFTPLFLAYAATLWFWTFNQEFFFTYNHIGGITMLMASAYALCRYIKNPRVYYLSAGALSLFVLTLIKINFGLLTFIAFLLSILVIDKIKKTPASPQKKMFFLSSLGAILLSFLIYFLLTRDLPVYVLRQCFPYLSADHPHNASVGLTLRMWWDAIALNVNQNWPNRLFAMLVILSIAGTLLKLFKNDMDKSTRQNFLLTVMVLAFFYVVNIHEYLVSGVLYRMFWAKPFSVLLMFLFIGFLLRYYPKTLQVLLIGTLLGLTLWRYSGEMALLRRWRAAENHLTLDKGQVMLGNIPSWRDTVEETTRFLQKNLKEDETFFALPYDPLYYFLSGKPSPTRQLIFFEHINIPVEQEEKIIRTLEEEKVDYILLSSRAYSSEPGLGVFGRTYCKTLADYIFKNYAPVKTFGNWKNPPGWAWNHGTKILKRMEK